MQITEVKRMGTNPRTSRPSEFQDGKMWNWCPTVAKNLLGWAINLEAWPSIGFKTVFLKKFLKRMMWK